MNRIFSNGRSSDYVQNAFESLAGDTNRMFLAAPYFTKSKYVVDAAKQGKQIQLLIGLNPSTSPEALSEVCGLPNVAVRYLTGRFHAKIYIFDTAALLGSSNLTDGGFIANREAVICLDRPQDLDSIEAVRALFNELWESGRVLSDVILTKFRTAWNATRQRGPDPNTLIEYAVGKAEPINVDVGSWTKSKERLFIDELERQIEGYRPAFQQVMDILEKSQLRRSELRNVGPAMEANRFLNWVRLTHVIGDEAWQAAPVRADEQRKELILNLGKEWFCAKNARIPVDFISWFQKVRDVFESKQSVELASKEDLTSGLISLHAFAEQLRFVKGGMANLPKTFWSANGDNIQKVKRSLTFLIHGPGDFVQRLHDVLYDPDLKLPYFGRFCAMELFGTIRPEKFPPINGRMAKALRYLGFDVKAN